jgi:hypothetical protein
MSGEKTVSVGFRVTPEFKRLLAVAARHDHRTMTSLLEKLLADHCRENGLLLEEALAVPPSPTLQSASRRRVARDQET